MNWANKKKIYLIFTCVFIPLSGCDKKSGSDTSVDDASRRAREPFNETVLQPPTPGIEISAYLTQKQSPINSTKKTAIDLVATSTTLAFVAFDRHGGMIGNTIAAPVNEALMSQVLLSSAKGETHRALSSWLSIPPSENTTSADIPALASTVENDDHPYRFELGVWGQSAYRFNRDYLDILSFGYGAHVAATDFLYGGADNTADIRSWVYDKFGSNDGLAAREINELNTETRLLVLSSLNWNAAWRHENDARYDVEVFDGLWQGAEDYQQKLPMLRWRGTFPRYDGDDYKAVKILLGSGEISLTVVIPGSGQYYAVRNRLRAVLTEFDANQVVKEMEFTLPIFQVDTFSAVDAPLGGISTVREQCDQSGGCEVGRATVVSTTEDYSAVNGAGHLYRDQFNVRTAIQVNAEGVSSKSLASLLFKATADEPVELMPPPNLAKLPESYGLHVTGNAWYISSCDRVYEAEGPTQSRPFIFVFRYEKTGAILNVGQTLELAGEKVGKEVCSTELISYEDQIWPTNRVGPSTAVSSLAEYQSGSYESSGFDAKKLTVKPIIEAVAFDGFASKSGLNNFIASPHTESQVVTRLIAGTNSSRQTDLIQTLTDSVELSPLYSTSRYSLFDLDQNNITAWGQTGYQFRKDFLATLGFGLINDWYEFDFFNSHADFHNLDAWITELSGVDSSFGSLDERSRLVIADKTQFSSSWSANSMVGIFENVEGGTVPVKMTQLVGRFPYFEDSTVRAVEVLFTGRDTSLLIVMPKKGNFANVAASLKAKIENIDKQLQATDVTIDLPNLDLWQASDLRTPMTMAEVYSGASDFRPLILDQARAYTKVSLNQDGIDMRSYSVAVLAAPKSESVPHGAINIGSDSFNFPFINLCGSSELVNPSQAWPFFFVLRDNSTKTILYSGRITTINGANAVTENCNSLPLPVVTLTLP